MTYIFIAEVMKMELLEVKTNKRGGGNPIHLAVNQTIMTT